MYTKALILVNPTDVTMKGLNTVESLSAGAMWDPKQKCRQLLRYGAPVYLLSFLTSSAPTKNHYFYMPIAHFDLDNENQIIPRFDMPLP